MTLFPFVILRDASDSKNAMLVNHEKIHLMQQIELLILPFYIFYVFGYLVNLIKYRDKNKAYRNIVFEREAYANETDLEYLKTRPLFGFFKYVKMK